MRERGNKKREKLFVRGDEETFFFFDFSIFCSSFFLNIFVKKLASVTLSSLPNSFESFYEMYRESFLLCFLSCVNVKKKREGKEKKNKGLSLYSLSLVQI